MGVLLDYQATLDQNPGWPTWTTQNGYGGASSLCGFGLAIMTLPAGVASYGAGRTELYNGDLVVDGTTEFDLKFPAGTYEGAAGVSVRDSGSQNVNCYTVFGNPASRQWFVRRYDNVIQPGGQGLKTDLGLFNAGVLGGKTWRVKIRAVGSVLQVRAWEKGTTEPTTWGYDATVTGHIPTGVKLRSSYTSGLVAVPAGGLQAEFDNFLFTDTVVPPSGINHARTIRRVVSTHTG